MAQLVKNLPAMWETWVQSLSWEDSLGEGNGYSLPVFWPEEFHGLDSPWGHKELDMTESCYIIYGYRMRTNQLLRSHSWYQNTQFLIGNY